MKYREKGPIEYVVRERSTGKKFTFLFKLIDYVPRVHPDLAPCSFCPFEDTCDAYPDPRDLRGGEDFNNFCAAMDDELGGWEDENGNIIWRPIPIPSSVEKWLDEIKKEGTGQS